jgi:muramoyltetrapeptide carboxypeptidase
MLIRPRHLEPGDTLGIIAPASAPPDPRTIDHAAAQLETLGFRIKLAPNVRRRHGYLAGSDRERAGDLMRMFADHKVNAILCVRGGYGSARLLPLLDYRIVRTNPKIFVGYSDITSLHCAFLTQANLISFHGPMLASDFAHADMPPFTLQNFFRTLGLERESTTATRSGTPGRPVSRHPDRRPQLQPAPGSILPGYRRKTVKILRRGRAHGQLIGGNLTLLCTLIGTPWQPPFKKRILFFEDLGEEPFRFDRMLTHLLSCGLLQQLAGVAVGLNVNSTDPKARRGQEFRQTLEDVLKERLLPLNIPIVTGLPFGHVRHNATLPLGVRATLDANAGDLVLTESAVC